MVRAMSTGTVATGVATRTVATRANLLAFDLDKTIVRNDYTLPPEIKEAIHAARNAGHLITVLTGRPQVAALPFLQELDVHEYYSTNHGALVTGRGEILRQTHIGNAHVKELLEDYLEHPDIDFSCVVDDTLHVKDPSDPRWAWAHTLNRHLSVYDHSAQLNADKIVFTAEQLPDTIFERIRAVHPEFVQYQWEAGYLEVTAPNADKGSALELLARELGVERQAVIAFGDGPNDTTMLAYAGHGVSVGPHAHPDTRAAADEHVSAPEALGVAHWLRENLAL